MMPTGGQAFPTDSLGSWLCLEALIRSVMQSPFTGHVNRHHWKRMRREAR